MSPRGRSRQSGAADPSASSPRQKSRRRHGVLPPGAADLRPLRTLPLLNFSSPAQLFHSRIRRSRPRPHGPRIHPPYSRPPYRQFRQETYFVLPMFVIIESLSIIRNFLNCPVDFYYPLSLRQKGESNVDSPVHFLPWVFTMKGSCERGADRLKKTARHSAKGTPSFPALSVARSLQ